jgi:hypothetical protein
VTSVRSFPKFRKISYIHVVDRNYSVKMEAVRDVLKGGKPGTLPFAILKKIEL